MADFENVFKVLHVLSAMVWFGAGVYEAFASRHLFDHGDEVALAWAETGAEANGSVHGRAAVATLLFGILTVIAGPWSFAAAWIGIGFAGVVAGVVVGAVLIGRTDRALTASIGDVGIAAAATQTLVARRRLLVRIDVAILVLVVVAMVTKPGG